VRKHGLSEHDATDAFQNAWLAALSARAIPAESELAGWLVAVASAESRKVRRRRKLGRLDPAAVASIVDAKELDPRARLARAEDEQAVREAFEELPSRERRLLELLVMRRPPVSHAEAAATLGIAENSVGPLRRRALDLLRAALEQHDAPVPSVGRRVVAERTSL
jgi:RNA polymerase sigma factor (sigma-70 family)